MEKKSGFQSESAKVLSFQPKQVGLYNLSAEQIILGLILYKNLNFETAATYLTEDSFYAPAHRIIWAEMKKKIDAAEKASVISLSPHIKDLPEFEQAGGGDAYLAGLLAGIIAPELADVDGISKTIRDYYLRRTMLEAVEVAAESIKNNPSIYQSLQPLEIAMHKAAEDSGQKLPEPKESWLATVKYVERTRNGELSVQETKLHGIDSIIGGLQNGCLYVLAGATGMGKTALGLNIAKNVALDGPSLYFSIEMSSGQLLKRLAAEATGVTVNRQNIATVLTDDEMRRLVNWQPNSNLKVIDTAHDLPTMANMAKKFIRKFPDARLIVIDYLQLINGNPKLQKVHQIEEITKALKQLAIKINLPIILLSQLSRGVSGREDKRPVLSDLRDSGAIEQDADCVLFVYRHEYYLKNEEPRPISGETPDRFNLRLVAWQEMFESEKGKAEVIIAKNRYGETGTARLKWNGARSRFSDLEAKEPEQQAMF